MMRTVCLTLTFLSLGSASTYQNCVSASSEPTATWAPSCGQPICQACPATPKYNLSDASVESIVPKSPYFTILAKKTELSTRYDSQCFTFLALANNTYIMLFTTTNSDNSSYTGSYFYFNPFNTTGFVELVGLSGSSPNFPLMVFSYVIETICEGISKMYNCLPHTAAEGCNPIPNIFDPALSFALTTDVDPYCVDKAKERLEFYTGPNTIMQIPNQLPVQCVASYSGIPTINAFKLHNNPKIIPISIP